MSLGNPMRQAIEGLDTSNATPINIGSYKTLRVQAFVDGERMVTVGISPPQNLRGDTTHPFLAVSASDQEYGSREMNDEDLRGVPNACLLYEGEHGRKMVELLSLQQCEGVNGTLQLHFHRTGTTQWYRPTV